MHRRAGSPDVVEFHGNLFDNRCVVKCCVTDTADLEAEVPACPGCGGMLRTGVVCFGESIPPLALETAAAAAADCDVFRSIGTSSLVWPAAGLGKSAKQGGATLIEVNLDATPLSGHSDFVLQGKSGEIVPELVHCLAA